MRLTERVEAWRREFARLVVLEAFLRLVGWSCAALLAAVWIDEAFSLPQGARWLMLAAAAAGLSSAVHVLLVRPWRRFEWRVVLDAAARRFPALREHLKPAWELLRAGPSPFTSPELRQAHLERTERLLEAIPRRPVFPWRPSPLARRGALAAVLAGFTVPWLGGGASWERVLAPWRDVPLERFVAVAPGEAAADWGAPVEISARWAQSSAVAKSRRELALKIKAPGGWRTVAWDRLAGDSAAFSVDELTAPLEYRLSWRDLQSRVYRLIPVAAPRLDSVRARVRGRPGGELLALGGAEPLAVLRGSWVTLTGRPNQPLARAALRLSSHPVPAAMKLLPSGEYEALFAATEDATLSFDLESRDGRRDPHPPVYAVKAVPDEPPRVELLSPLPPLQASPADAIPIAYSARDDGGLARVSLLVRQTSRAEIEIAVEKFSERPQEHLGDYLWELSNYTPGKLEFRIKADDDASPAKSGYSEIGVVEVMDFESAHAQTRKLWLSAEEELKALAARHEAVGGLLGTPAGQSLESELAALPQAWKSAEERLGELSRAMARDAYANPGLGELFAGLAAEFSAARARELPAALEEARSGRREQAQRRHRRLGDLAGKGRRLLQEGRRFQGLQDFHTQASQLGRSGAEIEAALEGLSAGRAASPEVMRRLQSALSNLQKQLEDFQKVVESLPEAGPGSPEEASRRTYAVPLGSARQAADALSQALAAGDFAAAARIAKQLSDLLSRIQKAIGEAAAESAAAGLSGAGASRLEKAQGLWSQAVEEQTRALEQVQRLEDRRLANLIESQKRLLAELSREQGGLVSSAAALGAPFPAQALSSMKAAGEEFDALKVSKAPVLLRAASQLLRLEASRAAAPGRQAWEWFASAEDSILKRLEEGPPAAPVAPDAESAAAAAGEARARATAGRLQEDLESFEAGAGPMLGQAARSVEEARSEQGAAEGDLGRGDSMAAFGREEKALFLLERAGRELSEAAGLQQSLETGLQRPFERPSASMRGAATGSGGSRLGHVSLPSAKDYRPPERLREELKKSLQESRPLSYDKIVKEYFKRIAQ